MKRAHAAASAFALAALLLTAIPLLGLAQGNEPVVAPTPSSPPVRGSVWTVFNTVEATIDDNYATVRVIADIGNRGPDPEFPFQVSVPDDAFVTGLTITRDGVTHEARIEDRAVARAEYEETKAAQQTGGLVEKQRRSSTYAFLVNVAEFESVRAVLTYERYLAAVNGTYELDLEAPVSGFGEDLGARFDVLVRHTDGVAAAWGDAGSAVREAEGFRLSHQVGARPDDASTPFTAAYTLPATADEGSLVTAVHNGTGYFAHRFRAPAEARQMPLDLVLVLDVSGSMSGLKMQQMQDAARQLLGYLDERDRLHLVFFSTSSTTSWSGLRDVDADLKREAAAAITDALAAGGTNLEAGVRDGFAAFDGIPASEDGRLPALAFLTDGQPSAGVQDRAQLRAIARDANDKNASVFAIAFGADADWRFISQLAEDGDGAALRVPEGAGAEVDLARFLAALTTPVLRDVLVAYDADVDAHRRTADVLFAGSELLVVGTFDPAIERLSGRVTARADDGPRSYAFDERVGARGGAFLPRLVAYHEILRHQDLIDAEGERADWVQNVTRLALEHGFVTDYTSLVLSLPPSPRAAPTQGWAVDDAADGRAFDLETRADSAPSMGGWAPTAATGMPAGGMVSEPAAVPAPGLVLALMALAAMAALYRRR